MENLLNNPSALHNFKQANGLYVVNANSVTGYILERRLLRILKTEVTSSTVKTVASECGLSYAEIEDLIEGKVYDLGEKALRTALETYFEKGISACLKCIDAI